MTLLFSIRVGDARTLAPRTTQQERPITMDGHLCHGAVNKPTAMDIQPSVDVHRRIPERNLSLKYIYLHKLVKSTNTAENKMYKHKYAIYCSALQLRIFSPVQCHLQQRQEAVYEDYYTAHAFGRSVIIACCTLGFQLFASIL